MSFLNTGHCNTNALQPLNVKLELTPLATCVTDPFAHVRLWQESTDNFASPLPLTVAIIFQVPDLTACPVQQDALQFAATGQFSAPKRPTGFLRRNPTHCHFKGVPRSGDMGQIVPQCIAANGTIQYWAGPLILHRFSYPRKKAEKRTLPRTVLSIEERERRKLYKLKIPKPFVVLYFKCPNMHRNSPWISCIE
ncbi:hypothetical protein LNV28_06560 [Paucibacter sp. DJ2R-2]|nr:hypothetical protein [Paucibacter sp. DJ2R-2]MCV2419089.1 hypothetical protein [Paucibacter sp. DJ4R-1]MCV2437956.1 hypothetical protein [Paucibacter sp. DJ2R-2]